jgi:hypothetical protein
MTGGDGRIESLLESNAEFRSGCMVVDAGRIGTIKLNYIVSYLRICASVHGTSGPAGVFRILNVNNLRLHLRRGSFGAFAGIQNCDVLTGV